MSYNNDYTYRIIWRDDSILKPAENHIIVNNYIILGEIPDANYRVFVSGYTELYGDFTTELTDTTFRVDYTTGLVNFAASQEGVEVTVSSYYGRGIVYFPYTRIYTQVDGETVLETLYDVVESASEVTDVVESIQVFETYNPATTYQINNKAFYDGSTYYCIQESTGNQPDISPTYWGIMAQKGDQGIQGEKGLQWQGTYSGATAYIVDDVVEYDGSSYINILDSTGIDPTNPTYWSLLAQRGDDGVDLVYKGDYSAITPYVVNDAVRYNNTIYSCIQAGTGQQPDISPTYWIIFMEDLASANSVQKSGDTMTGALNMQDDVAINFGTDTDMSFYHDNANSKNVIDNGAIPLEILYSGTEKMAVFNPNWKVELYYDNSLKFETATDGVDVTGNVSASGDVSTGLGNTIDTNKGNIDTNALNISTNTSNISTNTGNISTNTTNISNLDTVKMDNPTNNDTATNGQVLVSNGDTTSTFQTLASETSEYTVGTGKEVNAQKVVAMYDDGVGDFNRTVSNITRIATDSFSESLVARHRICSVNGNRFFGAYDNSTGTYVFSSIFYFNSLTLRRVSFSGTQFTTYDVAKLNDNYGAFVYNDISDSNKLKISVYKVYDSIPLDSATYLYSTTLIDDTKSVGSIRVEQITTNKIIVTYGSSNNIYGRIISFIDGSISLGTETLLVTNYSTYYDIESIKETRILISSRDLSPTTNLAIDLFDVSGTTPSSLSSTTHAAVSTVNEQTIVKYQDDKAIVLYESINRIYYSIIGFASDTLSNSAYVQYTSLSDVINVHSAYCGYNRIYFMYCRNTDDLYIEIVDIDGTGTLTTIQSQSETTSNGNTSYDFDVSYFNYPVIFSAQSSPRISIYNEIGESYFDNNNSSNLLGIATTSGVATETINVSNQKEISGFSNLTIGSYYYAQPDGTIGHNNKVENTPPLGVATSTTTLRMLI